jgi:uncharacterized membrane-anchored protein
MKKSLPIILAFWAVIFAVFIIPNTIQIVSDDYPRVILKTQPVDPRDFLRGDFVILSYEFATVNRWSDDEKTELEERLGSILEFSNSGDKVYAVLDVAEDKRAEVVSYKKTKPNTGLFLRGVVRGRSGSWNQRLDFGIEKYFVPEGRGWELEQERNASNLEVEVAINPKSGKALITDILVSEDSFEFEKDGERKPRGF